MKRHLLFLIGCLVAFCTETQNRSPTTPTIYIVMRWPDTQQKTSFYSINESFKLSFAGKELELKLEDVWLE